MRIIKSTSALRLAYIQLDAGSNYLCCDFSNRTYDTVELNEHGIDHMISQYEYKEVTLDKVIHGIHDPYWYLFVKGLYANLL
jgi:hypothetical protein